VVVRNQDLDNRHGARFAGWSGCIKGAHQVSQRSGLETCTQATAVKPAFWRHVVSLQRSTLAPIAAVHHEIMPR
jgi:hypothetical protein